MARATRKTQKGAIRYPARRPRKNRRSRKRISLARWLGAGLRVAGWLLLLAGINVGCLYGYNHLTTLDMFQAHAVDVSGNRRLSEAAVRHQAGIEVGDNILAVNLARSRRRLLAHPWVAEAELYRDIPNRIRIRVREHECLALIDLGRRFLIGRGGVLFSEAASQAAVDVPLVTGLDYADLNLGDDPASPAFQAALDILKLSRRRNAVLSSRQIKEIRVDRDTGVTLVLRPDAGGPPVQEAFLGYGNYSEKLEQLADLPGRLHSLGRSNVCRWVSLDDRTRTIVQPVGDASS